MDKHQVSAIVWSEIKRCANPELARSVVEADAQMPLDLLGIDSTALIHLFLALEEKLHINLEDLAIGRPATIGDVIEIGEAAVRKASGLR
ncbi:phosphopantetheine-binding protein [Bradyrhizobium sp. 21]|uniref:phosphopantetheine-binding protein n=1 Tax=Bradyrhizobium sp. 21 TaxID=2782666 RepID=UPI001FF9BF52|nr:phosphopantetheine-binding protein [Bradyrhizobium sp. 21]MCK1387651.1 hypothetical protein [Bradyrhizobium sp. 21]